VHATFGANERIETLRGRGVCVRARLVLSFAFAWLIASPVVAADLAWKAPVAVACQWCGWYAGVHGGFAWGDGAQTQAGAPAPVSPSPHGEFGGVQIGYNWVVRPNVLVGLETDLSIGSIADHVTQAIAFPVFVDSKSELEYFGTVRARVGYLDGAWLVYATGGLAWGRNQVTTNQSIFVLGAFPLVNDHQYHVGWTAGAGVEVAVAPRWTAKAEYLYADLGSRDYATNVPVGTLTEDLTLHMVRLGLNYKFNTEGSTAYASTVPAPPRTPSGWAGWYVGVHAGYGWGNVNEPAFTSFFFNPVPQPQGGFGGVQVGYNWLLGSGILVGLEGDVSVGSIKGAANIGSLIETKTDLEYFGTLRARAGYVQNGWLVYGTGGLAVGRNEVQSAAPSGGGTQVILDDHQYHLGWTLGAGVETVVSTDWSVKAEYLYLDLGTKYYAFNLAIPPLSHQETIHTVKLGANYKFDGFGGASAAQAYAMATKAQVPARSGWAGFYLGAHAGWANFEDVYNITFIAPGSFSTGGFIGGALAGYNFYLAPQWVAGIEADAGWSGVQSGLVLAPGPLVMQAKLNWDTHVRARAGYANGNWLIFAAGGFAAGRFEQNAPFFNSADNVHLGVTGGFGVDYAATENWVLRAEYLRSHYFSSVYDYTISGGGTIQSEFDVDTWRGAAIYRF